MNTINPKQLIKVSLEDNTVIFIEQPNAEKQALDFAKGLTTKSCTYKDETLLSELSEKGFFLVICNTRSNFESGSWFSSKIVNKESNKVVQEGFSEYPYMVARNTRSFIENL